MVEMIYSFLFAFGILGLYTEAQHTRHGENQRCSVTEVKHYPAPKTFRAPVIDGKLDEEVWENAAYTSDFGNIQGPHGPPPPISMLTRTKVAWDSHFVYIGAMLFDPFIAANVTRLDSGSRDRTNHQYKRIQVNPLGIYRAVEFTKPPVDGGIERPWDLGSGFKLRTFTSHEVHIVHSVEEISSGRPNLNSYWSVEMAIPIHRLKNVIKRGPDDDDGYSNFNFMRSGWPPKSVESNDDESPRRRKRAHILAHLQRYHYTWSPQYSQDIHNPEWWGTVYFSNQTKDACFKPDASYNTRYVLMQIYWAQKNYYRHNGRYSADISTLSTENPMWNICTPSPKIQLTNHSQGFQATIPDGEMYGHIRQDRYLWYSRY
ncbi:hypothetical protein K493DRAFT_340462 [Basidiobolus meristosporus CBS 931.73]|uniref:Uncharacterized protein n=1 Tax=Basidiobolus meristosporus CBS 931.73 TaxID=1314790 RepID=A0A1Y1XW55_9FUNG|nr:hypothetical protein K493DRAFT_340462 [Basidiobolus meristosporus CBS 931.73]|eukprot:ORX89726.1 hypothetical protein K493DRAFT_340462 [Basidiobolus meristosporus CBS 931.73]